MHFLGSMGLRLETLAQSQEQCRRSLSLATFEKTILQLAQLSVMRERCFPLGMEILYASNT